MDVLRLTTQSSSWRVDEIVEGYSSLIWTERYLDHGEFEMKTYKVKETRALIPEGSLITLMDTHEIMMVENHAIDIDDDGIAFLTVTGRSFETFLEQRVLFPPEFNIPWEVFRTYTVSEMASLLAWNALVNNSAEDPTYAGFTKETKDRIPYFMVTDSTTIVSEATEWWLETGYVYPKFRDILTIGGLGVRNIRQCNSTGNEMTFNVTTGANRGLVTKVTQANITYTRMDIYNGTNRTKYQSDVPPVIFVYDSGDINNTSYLFSNKDYKTTVLYVTENGNLALPFVGGGFNPYPHFLPPYTGASSLSRRVLLMVIGEGEELPGGDPLYAKFASQYAITELAKHTMTAIFDGVISPNAQQKYGEDYFLGDTVTLMAEYGYENSMMVTEFVRTEDMEGDRGFPTLALNSS